MLLLDEPLSALDAHTRAACAPSCSELLRELGLPTILVTHDFEDAAALADRVGVLVAGGCSSSATPDELVAAPADAFVAELHRRRTCCTGSRGAAHGGLTRGRARRRRVVFSADEAEGAVGVVVYPWEVSVARAAPRRTRR